jgi:Zn-finger nucleic acid-binding protein
VCGDPLREVRAGGDRLARCDRCGGVWLEWTTFVAMWSRVSPDASEPVLTTQPGPAGHRGCPACGNPMARLLLRAVPIDHCGAHGVWFDRVELEAALAVPVLPADQWFRVFAIALLRMS